jgi:1,4-alpha-glucan branching enzyme
LITLDDVGAFAGAPNAAGVPVRFGIYLPGINQADGYEARVRVIHSEDRFDPDIQPLDFTLAQTPNSANNLWRVNQTIPITPNTRFGQAGVYLYRYQLLHSDPGVAAPTVIAPWFTDPFARATDTGQLSAFATAGYRPDFAWGDEAWKTPELDDLVVYELHVEEFNDTFAGVVERLPYLTSLGVTCLELMPVTSLKLDFDWGYGPLHYFAPNERWGGGAGLKRLVDACHRVGVAVILDVVYQHVDPTFPYHLVYEQAGIPSPMIDGWGPFGPQIDFSQEFARDYVRAANSHWLREYHVDGFRYDEVTDLYVSPTDQQYVKLAYDDYTESLTIPRFTPSGGAQPGEYSRIIQAPEALNRPQEILRETYSSAAWQDSLLNKAQDMARYGYVDEAFVRLLDVNWFTNNYPLIKTVQDIRQQPVDRPVAPFQYLETHDHSQLIHFVGQQSDFEWDSGSRKLTVPYGDRSKFYKLQPFASALFTCEGTPMLFQGQEFADSYVLPGDGTGRNSLQRNVHWEYFYDAWGAPLVRLYRRLGQLRRAYPALRCRDPQSFYYYTDQSRPGDGIVAYRRQSSASQIAMVMLNFSDAQQSIAIPFPAAGAYREMIDDPLRPAHFDISVGAANQMVNVTVPSNYGYIFLM